MVRKVMIPIIMILSAFTFCGCENEKSVPAETSVSVSETTAVTSVTKSPDKVLVQSFETLSGRNAVTFAPAETNTEKPKTTVSETTETEENIAEIQLAENQLDYKGRDFYLLMEFNGVESMKYYSKSLTDRRYVLHSKFTVTNVSKKSFDFLPRKMLIYGRHSGKSGLMAAMDAREVGLAALDASYTIEAGETISIDVDFIGDEMCVDYADEIFYNSETPFKLTKRNEVKNAIRAARDMQAEKNSVPEALVPREGEYSVLTHKNSYCFTAEPVVDGKYIKIILRIQCLTGEPEAFDPYKFRLYRTAEDYSCPCGWSFDTSLVRKVPEIINDMDGINETIYDTPKTLSVRPDGSAEYTMYFHSELYDPSEYYKFCYDGKNSNDVFECILHME